MSLFKLLFKFNPSKLKVVPAERMTMQMREQISEFLGDISKRITKGDYDVTPGQLQYLKDQGDEITRMDMILADRAARNKQGVGSFMKRKPKEKPSAEVVDFPKTPKPPEGEPFAFGGRVGYAVGGLSKGLQALVKQINKRFGKGTLKTADEIDRPESAKTKQAIEDFEKRNPNPKRELTDEEYEDFVEELGGEDYLESYNFDGTVGDAQRILKEQKDYMDYMYQQYRTGKLNPQPGENSRSRMNYLRDKLEEAEMTDDTRLITRDEIDELNDLEQRFEYLDLTEKAQDVARPLSNEEITRLKELDDMGFANVLKALDRTKKAGGGLATLFMER